LATRASTYRSRSRCSSRNGRGQSRFADVKKLLETRDCTSCSWSIRRRGKRRRDRLLRCTAKHEPTPTVGRRDLTAIRQHWERRTPATRDDTTRPAAFSSREPGVKTLREPLEMSRVTTTLRGVILYPWSWAMSRFGRARAEVFKPCRQDGALTGYTPNSLRLTPPAATPATGPGRRGCCASLRAGARSADGAVLSGPGCHHDALDGNLKSASI